MNVLVLGSGGREHALCYKISQSSLVDKLYAIPGNGGINTVAECISSITINDFDSIRKFIKQNKIGFVVVGPEQPLADGIVDYLNENNIDVFGPNKLSARLESSKVYAKNLMLENGIPTASFKVFNTYDDARRYIAQVVGFPIVIKVDGLAQGKGSFVCQSEIDGVNVLKKIFLEKVFGESGNSVIIEDFISGHEMSIMAITNSHTILMLESSQDYKRIYDNDQGPNTGGMGAVSPNPYFSEDIETEAIKNIYIPVLHRLSKKKIRYRGVLYSGVMLTAKGLKVLEFNVRFGDPETQVVLARMKSDILPVLLATSKKNDELKNVKVEWDSRVAVCLVLVSKGYPEKYETNFEISGLDRIKSEGDIFVFHAGTKNLNGKFYTAGGRVLNIVALGENFESARQKVYRCAEEINFENKFYRKDIGLINTTAGF